MTISDTDEKSIIGRFNREMIASYIAAGAILFISLFFFMLSAVNGFKV
jgi:hypothetical protein